MEILGYLAAALIGLSLGLVGSGGSIMTIPVLVYLFHIAPTQATAYSLFIVGITSLVGGIRSSLQHTVDLKATVLFAIPSLVSVFTVRHWLIPLIPAQLAQIGQYPLSRDTFLMLFFALLMLASAWKMIYDKKPENRTGPLYYGTVVWIGLGVGMITGLIGAGGGFLIIPALVFFAGLPMKKAIGSSLLIIAANSLIGFAGDLTSGRSMDFPFLLLLAFIAITGILLGAYLSEFIDGRKLKKAFGWFVLAMGTYVVLHELLYPFASHVT